MCKVLKDKKPYEFRGSRLMTKEVFPDKCILFGALGVGF